MAKMLIAGEPADSESGQTTEVRNPATGEIVDNVPKGTITDIRRAIDAAQAALKKWSAMAPSKRGAVLLAAGVRIYEYQPAMMHAKTLLIDHRFVTLGSTNFDPRSFFLNSELNTTIGDPAFAAEVEGFFFKALEDSKPISYEEWRARGLRERFLGWLGLLIKDQL